MTGSECENCGGTGEVRIPYGIGTLVKNCPTCNPTFDKVEFGPNTTRCTVCNGEGEERICDGPGVRFVKCSFCGGSGYIPKYRAGQRCDPDE